MPRTNIRKENKLGYAAVVGLEGYCRSRVPKSLLGLIRLRASLLNGCTYCIDMHTRELRHWGESEERIRALGEAGFPGGCYCGKDSGEEVGAAVDVSWAALEPLFSREELAVLRLTDAVTKLDGGVPDPVWEEARRHFSAGQMGDLVLAIAAINVWNRIGIATQLAV